MYTYTHFQCKNLLLFYLILTFIVSICYLSVFEWKALLLSLPLARLLPVLLCPRARARKFLASGVASANCFLALGPVL